MLLGVAKADDDINDGGGRKANDDEQDAKIKQTKRKLGLVDNSIFLTPSGNLLV